MRYFVKPAFDRGVSRDPFQHFVGGERRFMGLIAVETTLSTDVPVDQYWFFCLINHFRYTNHYPVKFHPFLLFPFQIIVQSHARLEYRNRVYPILV